MNRNVSLFALLFLGLLLSTSATAAFNFYVTLEANDVVIEGEPSVLTMGGEDVSTLIEGYAFDHQVTNAGGRVTHGEIRIIKRVDKSSPLLHQALGNNQDVDVMIWFYRANPDDGETERSHTWTLTQGKITSISPWSTTGVGGGASADPFLEAITISYTALTVESNTGSTIYTYR